MENHRLNAHLVQLIDHCLRIRKYSRQTVITASWPVIIVDDKDIQRNAAFLYSRATFSTCPDCSSAVCTARSQGRTPASSELCQWHLQSALQFLPGYHLRLPSSRAALRCASHPGCVCSEMNLTDCCIATEAVAKARYIKRNARLRIAVRQFQVASLQVHSLLLILSHTVNLLIRLESKDTFS